MNVHFTELAEVVTYLHKTTIERVSLDDINHVIETAERDQPKARPPNSSNTDSAEDDFPEIEQIHSPRDKDATARSPRDKDVTARSPRDKDVTARSPNSITNLSSSLSSSSNSVALPNNSLLRVIADTKRFSRWMLRCLHENARQRLLVLSYFIDVARHFKTLNNYNGLWAFHQCVVKSRVEQDSDFHLVKKVDRDFLVWTQDLFRRDENNPRLYTTYSAHLMAIASEPKVCCFQLEVALLQASIGDDVRATVLSAENLSTRIFQPDQKRLDAGKLRHIMQLVGNIVDVRFARYAMNKEDPFDVHIKLASFSTPSPSGSTSITPTTSASFNHSLSINTHSSSLFFSDQQSSNSRATSPTTLAPPNPFAFARSSSRENATGKRRGSMSRIKRDRSNSKDQAHASTVSSNVAFSSSFGPNSYTNSSYNASTYSALTFSSALHAELEREMAGLMDGDSAAQREIVFSQFRHCDEIRLWIENEAHNAVKCLPDSATERK